VTEAERYAAYLEEVGPPKPAPEEFAWQWAYRGLPSEKELLVEMIQDEAEAEASEQMSLC
jgi:hypothetical protein